jgi:MerR family transcriptional regulator, thiopeptide resistance regulator
MSGRYTVKQLATLAGVTIRTLHHYDQIGLLKPSSVGANGYRYYGEETLYRLQQILFYRELDVPLNEIRRMVDSPDFDILTALEAHRSALQSEITRIEGLIHTVDLTTQRLKGQNIMSDRQLFRGFSDEEQEKMAAEAERRWDPETVRESNARWKRYSPQEQQRILDEGNAVYNDMIAVMSENPASSSVQVVVKRWHDHMRYFWSPNDDQLLALVDGYSEDPRFLENFEAMKPGLARFMRDAVQVYVTNRK